jgi:hypothetical protein
MRAGGSLHKVFIMQRSGGGWTCHQWSLELTLSSLAWVGAPRLVTSRPPDTGVLLNLLVLIIKYNNN